MFVWFWKLFHGSYSGFCCQLVSSTAIPAFSNFGTSFKPIYTIPTELLFGAYFTCLENYFKVPLGVLEPRTKSQSLNSEKYLLQLFVHFTWSFNTSVAYSGKTCRSFNIREWQNSLHTPIASISNNAAFGNRIMYQWFLWPLCNCCYMRMPFLGHGT